MNITSSSGRFALLPASLGNCATTLAAAPSDTCVQGVTAVPQSLFHNRNAEATLMPGVTRTNLFGALNHTFDNDYELYSDAGYYRAESTYNRNDGGGGPLTTQPIHLAATNYWNPFGPINFADGRVNPNRLPGLDINQIPAEGIALPFRDSGDRAFYRISERPGPNVDVTDESYRFVLGLRGQAAGWDFDTGFVYSEAETLDRTSNRIDLNVFMRQLALDTPDAYNPWTGGGSYLNNSVDTTLNPESTTAPFYASIDRLGKTRLALMDFKVSNNSIFELPTGEVGVAAGVEYRRHTYEDDRDPRLDGTAPLNNFVIDRQFPSSVMGSSDTPDTTGSRDVTSLFAEVAIPIISPDMNIPLVESLNLQIAGRYEDFSDVGSVTKPRVALSWYLHESVQLRASWSEGFKAPNLAQTSEPRISRQVGAQDIYFCQAQVNNGTAANLGACSADGDGNDYVTSIERITSGSTMLQPEESESLSYGVVFQPTFMDGLTVTVDYWDIDQTGIIGIFGTPNHLALDWANRINGLPPNPDVIRVPATEDNIAYFAGSGLTPVGQAIRTNVPYFNLDSRESAGVDISILYDLDTNNLGSFTFSVNAAKLTETFQSAAGPADFINEQNNPLVQVVAGGDLIERDQRPGWKSSSSVNWRLNNFSASLFASYIGEFSDTGVISDTTGAFWTVDS